VTGGRGPDDAADGTRGEGSQRSQEGATTNWQVSVPVPHDVAPEQLDAVIRYLNYLDARLDTIQGQPTVTLVVRALTLDNATDYAVERVLALIDAQPRA
jgi:hypothetical protein